MPVETDDVFLTHTVHFYEIPDMSFFSFLDDLKPDHPDQRSVYVKLSSQTPN